MQSIQQTLRAAAVNGSVPLEKALSLIATFDTERTETVELLNRSEKQVGMYLGEEIKAHVAKMTGGHFNSLEYHYEKPVGEQ